MQGQIFESIRWLDLLGVDVLSKVDFSLISIPVHASVLEHDLRSPSHRRTAASETYPITLWTTLFD